nr:CUB and sushi domain-containing protein 3-like [Lytechinus pictus]
MDCSQFGNLKGSSINHYLVSLLDVIQRNLDKQGHYANLCAVDFMKAFDLINHTLAIQKLIGSDVDTSILPTVCSFLTHRSQTVRYQGKTSCSGPHLWSPQGTKLDKTSCNVPAEVANGQVDGASTVVPVGTEVTVSCNTNYAPSGGPGVCTRSEVFADNQGGSTEVGTDEPSVVGLATCNELKCGKPAESTNTVEVSITEGALNEDFFYECLPNYIADGSLAAWCKLNANDEAEWIPSPAPSCSEIKCGAPSSVANAGDVTIDEGSIADTYSHSCNAGFAADGDLTTTCNLDDGGDTASWSPVGSCVGKDLSHYLSNSEVCFLNSVLRSK